MIMPDDGAQESECKGLAPIPAAWEYWDGTPLPKSALLRWGYTTGACVAAALTASWLARANPAAVPPERVDILFGDDVIRSLPMSPGLPHYPGFAVIRKNAGDDPDCTHGLLVACRLRPQSTDEEADPRDVFVHAGNATIRLHALCGVGLVTLEGLDCQKGHWAINPGVLRMIRANLARSGLQDGSWVGDIAIPGGETVSSRTLNKTLGVTGGLSLLGTTGLVHPFSHNAYTASVRLALRCAAQYADTVCLCTGQRTQAAARQWAALPEQTALFGVLPAESFISIADFLGDSLRAAAESGVQRVIVCCMPGKLLKYAAGCDNTHARKVAQALELLPEAMLSIFPDRPGLKSELATQPSMRAALTFFTEEEQHRLFTWLAGKALCQFRSLCPEKAGKGNVRPSFAILLSDFTGKALRFFPDRTFAVRKRAQASCP